MTGLALDDRDLQILTILSSEGRISKADLARRVNLSPTPCWQRLNRLEAAGLICGYHAEIGLARLAPHVRIFVTVELENHRAETFQSFERTIARIDEIVACWALGGGYDYLMQVITTDIAAYQEVMDSLLQSPAGLRRYFTYIVTKNVKTGAPPLALLMAGSS
ncbi:MAG: Lrp/AsnC family transcriptional regulator [Roseovarius sp.]|jgi:Lrp/AsnC family transcriptional regulator of ectoine degradation|nr:Lrp/AsnC family transcriptional regulator [Roseovarius sp.]